MSLMIKYTEVYMALRW